ncbi:PROCN (NUC071) domain [Carpediemonas membranifera]|uniref:PROCN (NUC071) domain n=1 Tax=Carpediemonas membranifera TaxID=201153 RepID=A0A8J6B3V5_9EUKA|nr:PROCN (NUC071) domain [Carpediemonas membranifera]|eukprot:KAG9389487.1 PROCN (NUC071) domain [Carpediemonas membranifera]
MADSEQPNEMIRMPPEHLRQIMRMRGDLSSKKYASERELHLGALRFLPHAVLKLFENMPFPWEEVRYVNAMYHKTGAITILTDVPRVIDPVYEAQWAATWKAMKEYKERNPAFVRMNIPVFDDDEPPIDYGEIIAPLTPPPAIELPIRAPHDFIYESMPLLGTPFVNGPSYKTWRLPVDVMLQLYLNTAAFHQFAPSMDARTFLFNLQTFENTKALNLAVPGGPKFEPLHKDDGTADWSEFSTAEKVLFRRPLRTEYQVHLPHLYNDRPRGVKPMPNSARLIDHVPRPGPVPWAPEDEVAGFPRRYTRLSQSPQPHHTEDDGWEDEMIDVAPALAAVPFPDHTGDGFTLLHAPAPFSTRSGKTVRPVDVNLTAHWTLSKQTERLPKKVRRSYQRQLKKAVLNDVHTKSETPSDRSRLKDLAASGMFMSTELDWVEAGLQICRQGYNALNLLVHKRNLTFLHLDYNFSLKPIKALTTKERKRARFGNAFSLMREIMRFTKFLVDTHVRYRMNEGVDAYQLADGLLYLFTHVGTLTGIYRHKYRTMRQIRATKELKHIVYYKFEPTLATRSVGVDEDGEKTTIKHARAAPCGFWAPMWRVWVAFLRGITPLLERWLGNLLARTFEGRDNSQTGQRVTKQRIEANFDLSLRQQTIVELNSIVPTGLPDRDRIISKTLAHAEEAWRCWKANRPWAVPGMPPPLEEAIHRFVRVKADNYVSSTHKARAIIAAGNAVDHAVEKKNLGRLLRLYVKEEHARQIEHRANPPDISKDAGPILMMVSQWAFSRGVVQDSVNISKDTRIPMPTEISTNDTKLLTLALEHLKEPFSVNASLNAVEREELTLIERAFDNPREELIRIKKRLAEGRTFKPVGINLFDNFTAVHPTFIVDPAEKIVDAYLDHYLWHEAHARGLFPHWVKPSDDEPVPVLVHKTCAAFSSLEGIWDADSGKTVLVKAKLHDLWKRIDLNLLTSILERIMDRRLAAFIVARYNATLEYKGLSYQNSVGIIPGMQMSGFVTQLLGLVADLMLLGVDRAIALAGPKEAPYAYGKVPVDVQTAHEIRHYVRHLDTAYLLLRVPPQAADVLVARLARSQLERAEIVTQYGNKTCWALDSQMRLTPADVLLGRAVFAECQTRVSPLICSLEWSEGSWASVYSDTNPALLFDLGNFEVNLSPKSRLPNKRLDHRPGVWVFRGRETCQAMLRVSDNGVQDFFNRIRMIIMGSGATTFVKIASRWNTAVLGAAAYYREAISNSPKMLDMLVRCETMIQTRIKKGLNTKMPNRFPAVVFFAPTDLGGLGMLSMGHILIPQTDLRFTQREGDATHFRAGMTTSDETTVPNLGRYIATWEAEVDDSATVWREYAVIRATADRENRRVAYEELEDLFDRGVPRINTIFTKNRQTLAFDHGWRIRALLRSYTTTKYYSMYWTNYRHDGRLYNLDAYRTDVVQALGGIECILEHTVFRATGFTDWTRLFWSKSSANEERLKYKKLTNAQRQGLSQIPNRRFTLWWSPTINRSDVYIGYAVQIELTGIVMHGKIPTLKTSLVQTFSGNIWKKIHDSIVVNLMTFLDQTKSESGGNPMGIGEVVNWMDANDKRKASDLTKGKADIVLKPQGGGFQVTGSMTPISAPTGNDVFINYATATRSMVNSFWLEVVLRWGDFDQHNTQLFAGRKHRDNTQRNTDPNAYPSATGVTVVIDLCYNTYSAYGNWIPNLKPFLTEAMDRLMKEDCALLTLRERVKAGLQLSLDNTNVPKLSSSNVTTLFADAKAWLVDDTHVNRVSFQTTAQGNVVRRNMNGATLCFEPGSGIARLRVVTPEAFAGLSKVGIVAKNKAAEDVAAMMRDLSADISPTELVVMREGTLEPMLRTVQTEHPNAVIRGTELALPVAVVCTLDTVNAAINSAAKPVTLMYHLYDDWTAENDADGNDKDAIQTSTAFYRLMLILRAMHLNAEQAHAILRPDVSVPVKQGHMWPSHSTEAWQDVEAALLDLILTDYAVRNNITKEALTPQEQRGIILGDEVEAPSLERQQAAEAVLHEAEQAAAASTATVVRTTDRLGRSIVTLKTSAHTGPQFVSQSDWQPRVLANESLKLRAEALVPEFLSDEPEHRLIISESLVRSFVRAGDIYTSICGFIFGREVPSLDEGVKTFNIDTLVMPPQYSTGHILTVAINGIAYDSDHAPAALNGRVCVGWMVTMPNISDEEFEAAVVAHHGDFRHRFEDTRAAWRGSEVIVCEQSQGSISVCGRHVPQSGLDFAESCDFNASKAVAAYKSDFKPDEMLAPSEVQLVAGDGISVVPYGGWNFEDRNMALGPGSAHQFKQGEIGGFHDVGNRVRKVADWIEFLGVDDDGEAFEPLVGGDAI